MSRTISSWTAILSTIGKAVSEKRCNRSGVAQASKRVTFNRVGKQQSRHVFFNGDMIGHKAQRLMKLSNKRTAE